MMWSLLPRNYKLAATLTAKDKRAIEEPIDLTHDSSPVQKLRPRSEVIIYNDKGILGIKKKDYLLLPGGGIAHGETPEGSAIRESLEEANAILKNLTKVRVVRSIYHWDNIISKGWDGEETHFFIALYGGDAKMTHPDRENFKLLSYDECISFLKDLMEDPRGAWAHENNGVREYYISALKNAVKDDSHLLMHLRKYASINARNKYKIITQ